MRNGLSAVGKAVGGLSLAGAVSLWALYLAASAVGCPQAMWIKAAWWVCVGVALATLCAGGRAEAGKPVARTEAQ